MIRVGNRVKVGDRYGTVFSMSETHATVRFADGSFLYGQRVGDLKLARGFAAMALEKQLEIAGRGGRAAHAKGRAYRWTKEQARAAGRKGGIACHSAPCPNNCWYLSGVYVVSDDGRRNSTAPCKKCSECDGTGRVPR